MSLFNLKITGAAGEGIKISGLIMAETCFLHGLYIHGYTEYPSLIRGGVNTFQIAADIAPVLTAENSCDLEVKITDPIFSDICRQHQLGSQAKNMVALGYISAFFNLDVKVLTKVIAKTFAKKSASIIEQNQQAAQLGYQANPQRFKKTLKPLPAKILTNQTFLTGNDALSLGAIAGGMKFFSAYPMTPATSILHFLASKAKTAGLVVRHAEDEIGVINMAIGASFAGARSMVATSGGGFSLMTEGLGLAGVSETPLVIVDAMRPGPATGMPTWTGQGDLLFVCHASQDEFPRIVLAPGDPGEAFQLTWLAQNLAEKYRLPVIILTDKYLAESYFTCQQFKSKHQNQRYPRKLPGQAGGVYLANSYEHDSAGLATEDSLIRTQQVQKRLATIQQILTSSDLIQPVLYGPKQAAITLITWGSNKGACLTALSSLPDVNVIHFPWLYPFPRTGFLKLIKSAKKLVTLELNSTGQLKQLIKQQTGIKIETEILKFDGRPFFPEEIIRKVREI